VDFSVVSPPALRPEEAMLDVCLPFARDSGSKIEVSDSISAAAKGADVIYTDVWASMGEEHLKESRAELLAEYRVDASVMEASGKPTSIFMHCLPANKGEEVTLDVIEGPRSRVFLQAENRKHTIKAIMLATIP
jgi:ornithine carbamoyltransferase